MDIHTLSALELAAYLDRGELSSREIVDALIARSDAVDRGVRGFVHRFWERARREATARDEERARGEVRGPLHGLPISVKESVDTAGVPSTLGIKSRLGQPAAQDAVIVRLARESGAIVLGKTNVPQTLLSPMDTTNFIWGRTRNPWSDAHASGGSSGGEAVVIATGQSPLGVGTDIGGSIRLPAAFCGIAGLKPTAHRWSNIGSRTAIAGQETVRAQIGPMARTVADLSFFLRTLDSPRHSELDPDVAPLPIGDPDAIDVSGLRVGWYERDGFFEPAASMRRVVRQAVESLAKAGATVVEYAPPNAAEAVYLMFGVLSSDGGATVESVLEGEDLIESVKILRRLATLPAHLRRGAARAARLFGEARVAELLDRLGRKDVEDLWAMTARRSALRVEELEAWRRLELDVVVCPPSVTPAAPHDVAKDFTLGFCYAARYNMLNLPAGVVPIGRVSADELVREVRVDRLDKRAAEIEAASEGLPLAVQVVGRPWQEDRVLAVMRTIEDAARRSTRFPWTPIDPEPPR